MNMKSLSRMLLGRLTKSKSNSRTARRLPSLAQISVPESLEPRLLMTADPDDQIRDAIQLGAITDPVTRTDSISVAIDVDIYRVDVTAGQRLAFDIDRPAGSQLDSYIRLFNSAGRQLAANDDRAAPGETRGLDSYLEFRFASAGSFFLGVSGFGNRSYNAVTGLRDRNGRTGDYSLVVSSLTTTVSDTDDQTSEAVNLGEISQATTRTGTIDVATDVDMYRFTLNSTRRVQFDIDRPSGSLDSFLRVFDSAGLEIARNDDGPTPGEASSRESFLDLNLNAGTYFIAVSGFGNSSFNAVTGTGDTNGSTGNYSLTVTPVVSDLDDQTSEAVDLGAISSTVTRTGLAIDVGTDVDMFRFTATAGQRLSYNVDATSQGFDSFVRLFDANGNELARNDDGPTPGESSSLESYLEFTFTTAGTYFLGVSGFGNSNYNAVSGDGDATGSTGQFSLEVSVVTVQPPPPPPESDNRVLYLNFDGANISRADLVRYAGNDWSGTVNEFDADRNGITVQPLLSSRSDREQIINQILSMVQIDLDPFGITVMRHTGGAVEGDGVTTIFLGRSSLSNDFYHVAADVDFGNNNLTDIAFVGDEDWGSASNTAIALSDVTLHEAGHTFGLYHVQSGTAPESMGLRYNTPQSQWLTDTRFVDQFFNELPGHGGGRGPQNAFQYMTQTFVTSGSQVAATGSGNALSPEAVLNILRTGYGEHPHNLPSQEGFGPDSDHHDHHHDGDAVTPVFTASNQLEAPRSATSTGSGGDVLAAAATEAERVAEFSSSENSVFDVVSETRADDDQLASSDYSELARQFEADAWSGLMDRLQLMA